MSPGAAAELDIIADADIVEDDIMDSDIMPELDIIEVSIAELPIIVLDIISDDIMSSLIVLDIIIVSDSIVSVTSAAEDIIVTVEAFVFVVDWAAARALRVQTITVMKRMLDF